MEISASTVRDLRERTGAGLMDCKKALTECGGDLDKAVEFLQIKGIAKAEKKAGRVASEGLVAAARSPDGRTAALIEINSETDFVARNDDFRAFVSSVAQVAADQRTQSLEALLAARTDGKSVEELRQARVAAIGENITVRRVALLELPGDGILGSYIHGGGSRGVLVAIDAGAAVAGHDDVKQLAHDLSMHVAASSPRFVRATEVDAATTEAQTRIFTEQAMESGKPREIAEKMVTGRIAKWKKEICLLDQPFVKNPEVTAQAEVDRVAKAAGTSLTVRAFALFVRGEGIEKPKSDLAAEVAKALS